MRLALFLAFLALVSNADAQGQRGAQPGLEPRIVQFEARPNSIRAGESVLLVWGTENPSGVTIEPGIGPVTARGSRQVKPDRTTTYTIALRNGPTRTVTVTVAGTTPADAAGPGISGSAFKLVRMPDGKPDLSGVYNFAGIRGAIPPALKPGAEKFRIIRGQPGDVRGTTTLGTDCKPLGVPQHFVTPYPFQIVQTARLLVMIFEYVNTVRFIPLDGRPHPVDPDPSWMGHSVGRWDGDVLVVDTTGFNEKTEVSGFMHTDALHVVERFRRLENGSLQYDVTVEDPNVWVSPWVMPARTFAFRPELEKIEEFVCESNPDYQKMFAK